jgi:hypothetical protein
VLGQGKNGFKGFMAIQTNIIVNGHSDLPRNALAKLYAC